MSLCKVRIDLGQRGPKHKLLDPFCYGVNVPNLVAYLSHDSFPCGATAQAGTRPPHC
jgi:hypothetical protein